MMRDQGEPVDPNRPRSIFAYAYTSAVAVAILSFGPLIVGGYVEFEGMREAQAGYLYSAEMTGYATSSLVVFALLSRLNWRYIVIAGLLTMLVANLATMLVHDYAALMNLRILSGLGAGTLMIMTMVSISLSRDPDRGYGLWTSLQLLIGGMGLFVLPWLMPWFGLMAPFGIVVVLALPIVALISAFPEKGTTNGNGNTPTSSGLLGVTGLCGIFVYYAGQAAVWAYLERMGAVADISPETVGRALSLSLGLALVGALAATWLGNRFGRRVPIVGSMLCSAVAIILLWEISSPSIFAVAACLFNAGWYFCLPYITAVIAELDTNGRLIIGLAVVYPASIATGPALAASLIGPVGLSAVLWIGLLSLPIGLTVMWWAIGQRKGDQ